MKKIAASVGLLALGASALYAAESSTLNKMQNTKAWSVQATLRGFYDDNIAGVPDSPAPGPTESFGFSISPSVDYGYAGEQTSFNVGYEFTGRFFDKKDINRSDKSDFTHVFDADISHAFSPRLDFFASESFVIGQEPDMIGNTASPVPIEGDNIRNFFSLGLNGDITSLLGFSVGYNNSIYDYDAFFNSLLYDRMEHQVRLDSRWKFHPQTSGVIGYTYIQNGYTENGFLPGSLTVLAESRDSQGHRFYVGADHVFNSTLSGSVRAGLEAYDYVNVPSSDLETSPYFEGSLRYQYQAATSIDFGARYSRTAASGSQTAGTSFIRDMETISVYGSIKHQLAQQLFVTGSAGVVHSTFNAPGPGLALIDGESFLNYTLGLDLSYQFNPNLSGHVGYNYDQLESDPLLRDYDRNRVYLGVTAGF